MLSYPTSALSDLIACPFCHELFSKGEAKECPACGLALTDLAKIPMSHDALAEDDFGIPTEPHLEALPWLAARRGRGLLVAGSLLGIVAFFAPWVNMTAPRDPRALGRRARQAQRVRSGGRSSRGSSYCR